MDAFIFRLPNELITTIFEQIDEDDTLLALAQSCSRLQPLAESVYYCHIFHRTGEEVIRLEAAIAARPERALYIQSIDSRCKRHRRNGLDKLAPVISQATNLRELILESPFVQNDYAKDWDELGYWRQTRADLLRPICFDDGLTNLRHLTLHLSDTPRYWAVGTDIAPVFAHPTLLSLTISCADLQEADLNGLRARPKTPLRELHLIECDITLAAFNTILALPRALEQLYLGENCIHQWFNTTHFREQDRENVNQLCSTDPNSFFEALAQQKHSLESLTYLVRALTTSGVTLPSSCKGLSEFYELKHVTLDGYCAYFEKAMTMERTAPPNLLTLTAKGDMFRLQNSNGLGLTDDYQDQVGWTLAYADFATHLEHMRIASSRTFTNMSPVHRQAVEYLGMAFQSRGVHMDLFERTFHGHTPPFLYGEREYREKLIYDSLDGFARPPRSSGDRELDDMDISRRIQLLQLASDD